MGCINTKRETEVHPSIYRVVNVDKDGIPLWSGTLEISPRELTLYRKGKEPTKWALQHLRRYGFDADLFTFEAGRRCTTGEGIYAFRCRRAESLFHLLQSYIHGIATNDDNTSTGLQFHDGQQISNSQINQSNILRSNSGGGVGGAGQQFQNINYVIPVNRNTTWNNGQSAGFTRSTDTLTGDYLDPTPIRHTLDYRHSAGMRLNSIGSASGHNVAGPLSPGEPNSPSSPNSLNVILEVTQLNDVYQQSYQNSNLYQEFPLRSNEHNNNSLNKKLSLDIPPQEPAPVITNGQPSIIYNTTTNQGGCSNFKNYDSPPEMMSPILSENSTERPYVNVVPGELDSIIGTPTTTAQINFSVPRLSTSTYSFDPAATRCYENLDLSVTGTPSSANILSQITRPKRYSKPEIFTKFELPSLINSSSIDNSEPSTPISISSTTGSIGGGGIISKDTRKVNYIVLDLDQSTSTNVTTNISTTTTTTITTTTESNLNVSISCTDSSVADDVINTSNSSTSSSIATTLQNNNLINNKLTSPSNKGSTTTTTTKLTNSGHLLSPESPKKASLGYATIDFNKTAALSNSTAPTVDDSEGSRKTRHSVSVRQSNSISE